MWTLIDEDVYTQDREWLAADFDELDGCLSDVVAELETGAPDLAQLARATRERVYAARTSVLRIVETLWESSEADRSGLGWHAMTSLATAQADVAGLQAAVKTAQVNAARTGTGAAIVSKVKTALKGARGILSKLSRRLMKMISGLVQPTGWTLGGEISGGLPGLGLGKVTMQIEFGP